MDYDKKHWKIGNDYFITILNYCLVTRPRIYIFKSDINGNHDLDYEGYIDNNYSHKDVINEYIKFIKEKPKKEILSAESAKLLTKEAEEILNSKIKLEEIEVEKYINQYIEENIDKINNKIKNACNQACNSVTITLDNFNMENYKNLFNTIEQRENSKELIENIFKKIFTNYNCIIGQNYKYKYWHLELIW